MMLTIISWSMRVKEIGLVVGSWNAFHEFCAAHSNSISCLSDLAVAMAPAAVVKGFFELGRAPGEELPSRESSTTPRIVA